MLCIFHWKHVCNAPSTFSLTLQSITHNILVFCFQFDISSPHISSKTPVFLILNKFSDDTHCDLVYEYKVFFQKYEYVHAIYNTTYIHQVLSCFVYFSTSHSTHLSGKFNEYILKALLRTGHIEKRKILLPSS